MITDRQDPRVLKAVEIAKKRANGYDEISGLPSDKLEAHHVKSWYSYPKLRADPNNLIMIDRRIHHGFVHNGYAGYLLGCSEKAIEGYRRLHEMTDKESPIFRGYSRDVSPAVKNALKKLKYQTEEYQIAKRSSMLIVRKYDICVKVIESLTEKPKFFDDVTDVLCLMELEKLGVCKSTHMIDEFGIGKQAYYLPSAHEILVDAGKKVGNLTKAECPTKKRGISIPDEELIKRAKGRDWEARNARRTLKQRGYRVTLLNYSTWLIMPPLKECELPTYTI